MFDNQSHYRASTENRIKYEPSGKGGTCSPPATPAKSKVAARGPQKGQQGLVWKKTGGKKRKSMKVLTYQWCKIVTIIEPHHSNVERSHPSSLFQQKQADQN